MRQAVDELRRQRTSLWRLGHRRLVQTLLERGTQVDLAEAQDAIDRLANFWEDDGTAMREITLLRLRALLSRARGDDIAYRDYRDRYRAMAESLGFEGHIGWAKAWSRVAHRRAEKISYRRRRRQLSRFACGAGRRCQAPPLKRGALSRIRCQCQQP